MELALETDVAAPTTPAAQAAAPHAVRITLASNATGSQEGSPGTVPAASDAAAAAARLRDDLRAAALRGPADHVLYQPSLVAVSTTVRGQAEAAAAAAAGAQAAQLAAALAAIRSATGEGLALPALAATIQGAGTRDSEALGRSVGDVLVRHGLVRRVAGWEGDHYVAAEHSQVKRAAGDMALAWVLGELLFVGGNVECC